MGCAFIKHYSQSSDVKPIDLDAESKYGRNINQVRVCWFGIYDVYIYTTIKEFYCSKW